MSRRRSSGERGFVMIYFALTLVVLIAAAAFTVDVGGWYYRAQQIQRAADAAALAGVPWMPNDFATAKKVALQTAQADGFVSAAGGVQVSVLRDPDSSQRLDVSITDPSAPRFFSPLFIGNVSETRAAVAEYDLPVPLGSPENSLGTGGLCLAPGGGCANVWLAVSGFCAAREDGDEYSAFYGGTRASGNTVCTTPGTSGVSAPMFPNPDYRPTGYTYDVDVPGSTPTAPTTASDVTVEIYDPAYVAGSTPGDSATGGASATIETNWLLYGPGTNAFDQSTDPIVAPSGGSVASPGKFVSGDATCQNQWCSLYKISAGSASGRYRFNVWTTANQAASYGSNNFALRAVKGAVPAGSVDSGSFAPCSTIDEAGPGSADPTCPVVHGEDAMGLFVKAAGSATCTPPTRQEQSGVGAAITMVSGAEPCANFFLAQLSSRYAGRTMTIDLFDPGEGATALRILQPDGTPASFTYETVDLPPKADREGPGSGAAYINSDGSSSSPPTATTTCICDPGLKPGPLAGRSSPSRYNDRYLVIKTKVPSGAALTANGGWYKVEYTFNAAQVSDRTTWSVSVDGNPVHLIS